MKKLTSMFLAFVMSFYGVVFMSPTFAFADNGNGNKNKSETKQEIKQVRKEAKQEVKKMKEEIKKISTWGTFMSSIRSNPNSNRFLNWFWWNKDNDNDENDGDEADVTPPRIVFATNTGLNASTTNIVWITNESSNSKVWISTVSPVSTTTAPAASSSALSFFHQLSLPSLATSTLYYYTISSTDLAGNASYYSTSFTTPAI